jgi:glycosyltransferase involved in cell wall biosynthesis
LKILFVIESLTEGGKERRLIELMKALKPESDMEFELVVMSDDVHFEEVFDLGINIHHLIRKRKKDLTVYQSLYKLCKNYKPDIIHCWDTMTAVYIVPVCKLLNIKFVNGIVMDAPEKRNVFNKFWLRAKLTFPFADSIVGNSKAGLKAYNAPKGKSHVIYNGFNFKRVNHLVPKEIIRKQLNISTKYIIGMVATFSDFKDYPTYFSAAQLLLNKRNDITFLAIGKNTDSVSSKKLIDNIFVSNFRLLGEKSDVESFVNAMDICILSTFTEGISNSILEYMALGKPVIATSGGGTCEIIEDNVTGFLVSQSNPIEISEKVELFLNDPELMLGMGNYGKERIMKAFSIDKMAGEFISVYKLLLSK